MASTRRSTLVAVFAHPDDEAFTVGGTLARLISTTRSALICATRGEAGQISDPALATRETLGQVREQELRSALQILGVEEVYFLGYRDSGMAGTAENDDPRAFVQADRDQVIEQLVTLFRQLQPDIVVTFDQTGAYGHPDHLLINQVTTAAFEAAADPDAYPMAGPATTLGRLYYASFPRSLMRAFVEYATTNGMDIGPLRETDPETLGLPDDAVDVVIDVSEVVDRKLAALDAHRTQAGDRRMIDRLSPELRSRFMNREYFHLAAGPALPAPKTADDLFAGLPGR